MPRQVGRAILLDKQGRALLLKRRGVHDFGRWELPGGKCEKGQTAEQATSEELRQEIGYEVEGLVFFSRTISSDGEWESEFFTGHVSDGFTPQLSDEHSEWCFVSLPELDSLEMVFDHGRVLRQFFFRSTRLSLALALLHRW